VIPKGSFVAVSGNVMCNDPSWIYHPEQFDPERIENETVLQKYIHIFGAGKHPCPGERFASLIIINFLYTLFKNYTLKSLSPSVPLPEWSYNVGTPWCKGTARIQISRKFM